MGQAAGVGGIGVGPLKSTNRRRTKRIRSLLASCLLLQHDVKWLLDMSKQFKCVMQPIFNPTHPCFMGSHSSLKENVAHGAQVGGVTFLYIDLIIVWKLHFIAPNFQSNTLSGDSLSCSKYSSGRKYWYFFWIINNSKEEIFHTCPHNYNVVEIWI